MQGIRPLEHSDLPAVTELLRERMPAWAGSEETLAATMLDHPWADPEVGPLVSVDQGDRIVGFIGVQVRRMGYGDRQIRGVVATQLVVTEDAGAAGALLLKRVLNGPQELTWSDGTTDGVVRIWRAFGGDRDNVRAEDWMLVLRPGRWFGRSGRAALGRTISRDHLPVRGIPFQAAGRRIARRAFPEVPEEVSGRDATPAELVEQLAPVAGRFRVRVEHDEAYLEHLFGLLEKYIVRPECRIVSRDDQPIGWYAYRPGRGAAARVLHLCAPEEDADAVLAELLAHARANGDPAIAGRAEPHLAAPLERRMAILGYTRQPVIHARDPELALAMTGSASLLTRLDGEVFLT